MQNEMTYQLKNELKANWFIIFLTNPKLYFLKLFKRTLMMGVVTFLISYLYSLSKYSSAVLPSSLHGVFGMAIGFLLVFRANTSYERWTDGRRNIANMFNSIRFICVKLDSCASKEDVAIIKKHLYNYVKVFIEFLKITDKHKEQSFREREDKEMKEIMFHIKQLRNVGTLEDRDLGIIENSLGDIINFCGDCERIKNTPIPISYALHIKISVFIYLASLPFGVLYEYHLWATVFVMILYYIMAGIEIISSEIENPFHGDPNDLPLEEYRKQMKEFLIPRK